MAARINKKKNRKINRSILHNNRVEKIRPDSPFPMQNGGGCEPHDVKCTGCGQITKGGEQYHVAGLQITPCFGCGCETALYEPQLR